MFKTVEKKERETEIKNNTGRKNNLIIYSYKSMELIHSFTQLFEFFVGLTLNEMCR